ncbi:uncharacterized protein K452DRAFT_283516, partial [Aplosporella prunicola CBS 121167]
MRKHIRFIFILIFCACGLVAAQDIPRCYYPAGNIAVSEYACQLNTTHSFCCVTGAKCLDNKLCDASALVNSSEPMYYRGTCTDKTWQSDECPKFCQG